MIEVKNLTKVYGTFVAVRNVSFKADRGQILGFLGPNGAGKTTTMRIITGFMPATSGTVLIDGLDIFSQSLEARRRIGYLPETPPLYVAQALVHDPPVLVLDEPTIGLDPRQIHEIRDLIRGLSGERTIVLSTHILPEVSQICDRVVIIAYGQVVLEESLKALPAGTSLEDVFLNAIAKERHVDAGSAEEALEEVEAGHS
jgi:ABC-2 type transport system ATP-binding protein